MNVLPCLLLLVACACLRCPAAGETASPAELVRELRPLSVRGVNYYPRETPWSGMWTATPAVVWERDMALVASLHANTVRTFVPLNNAMEKAGLLSPDGSPAPAYLGKIEEFLDAAWRRKIRVILCLDPDPKWLSQKDKWAKSVAALAERFKGDGRILLWDAMNEPESDAKWIEPTKAYLRGALPLLDRISPDHLTTVGLTWRADRLAETVLPEVWQYHEYTPKEILFKEGPKRVIRSVATQRKTAAARPLLIGEFGVSTARDEAHGCSEQLRPRLNESPGTEEEQKRVFGIVLEAAEKEGIAGVLPWCLHDYPIKNPNESHFGLFRSDGTAKPAAEMLRSTYARWSTR